MKGYRFWIPLSIFLLFSVVSLSAQGSRQGDSLALVDLYNATNGANWTNKWVLTQPINNWYGIRVNANGRVTTIDLDGDTISINSSLQGNKLSGTIPSTINLLSNLQDLSLSNNSLSSTIPSITISSLRTMYLHNNALSGSIQDFNLPNLDVLSLSANRLQGAIPNFTNLPKLRLLYLDGNGLTGSIPNFTQSTLELLHTSNNSLSGVIPNFNLPNLQRLDLSNNQLKGTIPNFILPKLASLHFFNNKIDSVPNLSTLPIKKDASSYYLGFRNQNNILTFDDIIPNIVFVASATYIYAPQDSIYKDTTITLTVGGNTTINLGIDGAITTNVYQWFKNGQPYRTTTTNTLPLSNLQVADAGVYTCKVTNPNAPLLTLNSRNITIRVNSLCRTSDSLALVALYNATNGANWTNKWDLTKPINTWYGITVDANGCVACIDLDGYVDCNTDSYAIAVGGFPINGNNLQGTIPLSLDILRNLKVFVLCELRVENEQKQKRCGYFCINMG